MIPFFWLFMCLLLGGTPLNGLFAHVHTDLECASSQDYVRHI